MQQVSTSVQNVSELARRTVDILLENFKVQEDIKSVLFLLEKLRVLTEK